MAIMGGERAMREHKSPERDPLDDPKLWRAIVERLGDNPMHCPYCIRDIAAENGISPERAHAKFLAHFHPSFLRH
jgi:hypothetical protein